MKDLYSESINHYTKLLLEGLKADGVLKENQDHSFSLIGEAASHTKEDNKTQPQIDAQFEAFIEFSSIIKNMFDHLGYGNPSDRDKLPLSMIINEFERRKVIRIPGQDVKRFKDILDKGKMILEDRDIKEDALALFRKYGLSFSSYIGQLLEYFTQEKAIECFPDFEFSKPGPNDSGNAFDLIGKNKTIETPDLAFEVKYRKNAFEKLRDDVIQLHERLIKYNTQTKKENYFLLVVYTNEGTSELQKLEYRFKKYIDELFPEYVDNIRFAPVYIGNLHFLAQTFQQIKGDLSYAKKRITEFKFLNQTVNTRYPEIDDHYLNKAFDLNQYEYIITVKPTPNIKHWRLGIKFAKENNFPNRIFRHSEQYPLFHLEKNVNSKPLMISYYGETNKQEFTKNTKIPFYKTQPVIIKLTKKDDVAMIDVLNSERISILDMPVNVHGYNWGILLAWADNRNPFEIETIIEESEHTLSP